jgi:SpoIID/LytB domain protein
MTFTFSKKQIINARLHLILVLSLVWPFCLSALASPTTSPQTHVLPQVKNPQVRVRMVVARPQVIVRGRFKLNSNKLSRYSAILVRRVPNGFKTKILGVNDKDIPGGVEKLIQKQSLTLSGTDLSIDEIKLPLQVTFVPNALAGNLDVVASVDLETYLSGVLPSEMPKSWPLEAIKAQAVASRTYVFKKMKERKALHFDVENSVFDQVFKWNASEGDPKILQVLKETNHQILIDAKSKVVNTFYHSQCGGSTEASTAVWGLGGLKSVKDKYCLSATKEWEYVVPKEKLSEMVKVALNLSDPGELMQLGVGRRTASGRADRFVARFSNNEKHFIRGDQMRSILGYGNLKSTRVNVESLDDEWSFKGSGFGHGVGMCQWGAKSMASVGNGYKQILLHYYPESKLTAAH